MGRRARGGAVRSGSRASAGRLACTAVLGTALLLPASAPAFRGRNGPIVFSSDRDGNAEIYVMNADGSGQTRLTNDGATDTNPSLSPDATKIVFASDRDGNFEIYAMNADGSGQTRLTNDPGSDGEPSYSPDGSQIAFESNRDGNIEIYVMNADGSGQTRLTNDPALDSQPAFSPDGSHIAFTSDRDGHSEIYVMNADGSQQTNFTNNASDSFAPTWAPGSPFIAYASTRDSAKSEIYQQETGSSFPAPGVGVPTRLTSNDAHDTLPAFAPADGRIAFASDRDGTYEIYTMPAGLPGTATRLTTNAVTDTAPNWGPAPASATYEGQWGTQGAGAVSGPSDAAADGDGNVYVADRGHSRIAKFTAAGDFVTAWSAPGALWSLATDASGHVYATFWAGAQPAQVREYDPTGALITSWGSTGSGDGQFIDPAGIAVGPTGNVYVSDTNAGDVQEFSPSGAFIARIAGPGPGAGQVDGPTGLAVDAAGNVFVADNDARVQKFGPSGFLTGWGTYGTATGQFGSPEDVAVDAAGNVFVADDSNRRIDEFTSTGAYMASFVPSAGPRYFGPLGVGIGPAGSLYAADSQGSRIVVFGGPVPGPATQIDSGPQEGATIGDAAPVFGFSSPSSGVSFECQHDAGSFAACDSSTQDHLHGLTDGTHTFRVRAVGGGATDLSPATRTFTLSTTVGLDPSPLHFGPITIGTTSELAVTVTNKTSQTVAFDPTAPGAGFSVNEAAGAVPADSCVTAGGASSAYEHVGSGATCRLYVDAAPASAGPAAATLTVTAYTGFSGADDRGTTAAGSAEEPLDATGVAANALDADVFGGLPDGAGPAGIAPGPGVDEMWYAETGRGRIGRITDVQGAFAGEYEPSGGPTTPLTSIVQGPQRIMAFTEPARDRLGLLTADGTSADFGAMPAGADPRDLVLAPDGSLWATEFGAHTVARLNELGPDRAVDTGANPLRLAVGSDLALWFTEPGADRVGRIAPTAAPPTVQQIDLPPGATPTGIAAGPDGALWVTERGTSSIARITTAGQVTQFPLPTSGAQPTAIVLASDRDLWFSETGAGRLGRITPAGAITEFPTPGGAAPNELALGFYNPDTFDLALWVTETAANRILRVRVPNPLSGDSLFAPRVSTGAATPIDCSSVELDGQVTPGGIPTSWQFVAGPTEDEYTTSASVPADAGAGSTAVPVSGRVDGLLGDTTYHYRLVAAGANVLRGFDETVTTPKAAAVATSVDEIYASSAKLHGYVTPIGADVDSAYVEWRPIESGTFTRMAEVRLSQSSDATDVGGTLTGLTHDTTYVMRVVAKTRCGTVTSPERAFTTDTLPPTVEANPAVSFSRQGHLTSVKLSGTVTPHGKGPLSYTFGLVDPHGGYTLHTYAIDPQAAPHCTYLHNVPLACAYTVSATLGPLEAGARQYYFTLAAQQGNAASARTGTIPFKSPDSVDLAVVGIQPTQGIQPYDVPYRPFKSAADVAYDGVDLVRESRATVARVFVHAIGATAAVPGAIVRLSAFLPGSSTPLAPGEIGPAVSPPGGVPADGEPLATIEENAKDDSAYLFDVPWQWLVHDRIDLKASVTLPDAAHGATAVECANCADDNTMRLTGIPFRFAEPFSVAPVKILVNGTPPDSNTTRDFSGANAMLPARLAIPPFVGDLEVGSQYNSVKDSDPDAATKRGRLVAQKLREWSDDHGIGAGDFPVGVYSSGQAIRGLYYPTKPGATFLDLGYGRPVAIVPDMGRALTGVAHELGHAMGLAHAGKDISCFTRGDGTVDTENRDNGAAITWPFDDMGRLQGVGYYGVIGSRAGGGYLGPPHVLMDSAPKNYDLDTPDSYYDFMSYCVGSREDDTWISVKNWKYLLDTPALGSGQTSRSARAAGAGVPILRIYGHQNADGSASIDAVVPAVGQPTGAVTGARDHLRVLDGAGHALQDVGITLAPMHIDQSPLPPTAGFDVAVPAAGATAVELTRDGTTVAQRTRSAHAPTVSLLAPRAAQTVGGRPTVKIRWTAGDADQDQLSATVDYSADDGRSWKTIYLGPADRGGTRLARGLLPASARARVRVRVNDGFTTTEAVSPRFVSLGDVPAVTILSPSATLRVPADAPVPLSGQAYDDSGRRLGASGLTWYDGVRPIGRGARVTALGLGPGRHRVTLAARDRGGRTGRAVIVVKVSAVRPQLIVQRAPKRVGAAARTVRLVVTSTVPATLEAGSRRIADVGPVATRVTIPVKPGRRALKLRLRLHAARLSSIAIVTIPRG